MTVYDLFVIGGGSGGIACGRRAAGYGAKVGLAEDNRLGGTCVIRGCVPKKLMSYGAYFADAFKAAKGFGWQVGETKLDFKALLEKRNAEVQRLNGIYQSMLDKAGVEVFPHKARIAAKREDGTFLVNVGDQEVVAKRVLLATGGKPSVLDDVPGIEHAYTSDDVYERVYDFPHSVAVIGGGYIGLETASIMAAAGSQVTVIIRSDMPLRGFDHDLRAEVMEQMQARAVQFRAKETPESIEKRDDGFVVKTQLGPLMVDAVVNATGRTPKPNTTGIGLEEIGVELDDKGAVIVNGRYESTVEGILAVGDCSDHAGFGETCSEHDLTPVAIAEGRSIAERLFNDNLVGVAYHSVSTAVFAQPQVACVGLSEDKARDQGYKVEIFQARFRPMLHTLSGLEARTYMKIVVDKSDDRVLGLCVVGDDAAEMVQGFAVAITAGVTKAQVDATVGLHPTSAEELVTMYQPSTPSLGAG